MSDTLTDGEIRVLLLDIEGTTTPVSFVYDVLFPYARERVGDFLREAPADEVRDEIEALRREHRADVERGLDPPEWDDAGGTTGATAIDADTTADASQAPTDVAAATTRGSAAAYCRWLMERDRKSTPLKSLQGKIWRRGYAEGELEGRVYPDVVPALERWRRQGRDLYIFSSGSVEAQKLLFSTTPEGDLTRLLDGHFDTTTGSKMEAESYVRIASEIGAPPDRILFLSDVREELEAAAQAGLRVTLCVREEEVGVSTGGSAGAGAAAARSGDDDATGVPVIRNFGAVLP